MSAVRGALAYDLDVDFAEELGPEFLSHFDSFMRAYVENPEPKPLDERQFEAMVASDMGMALECIQFCLQGKVPDFFNELIKFVKTKLSPKGQQDVDIHLIRARSVTRETY